ncbi:hypothetical protein VTL71DRAFT_740 [Oculimacula yallundae]|uniref:Uncharacterized protein n=1 Tax=Oculimacula yallundae TaxID=86028 RepID=A0ABR4D1U5_9HELO
MVISRFEGEGQDHEHDFKDKTPYLSFSQAASYNPSSLDLNANVHATDPPYEGPHICPDPIPFLCTL